MDGGDWFIEDGSWTTTRSLIVTSSELSLAVISLTTVAATSWGLSSTFGGWISSCSNMASFLTGLPLFFSGVWGWGSISLASDGWGCSGSASSGSTIGASFLDARPLRFSEAGGCVTSTCSSTGLMGVASSTIGASRGSGSFSLAANFFLPTLLTGVTGSSIVNSAGNCSTAVCSSISASTVGNSTWISRDFDLLCNLDLLTGVSWTLGATAISSATWIGSGCFLRPLGTCSLEGTMLTGSGMGDGSTGFETFSMLVGSGLTTGFVSFLRLIWIFSGFSGLIGTMLSSSFLRQNLSDSMFTVSRMYLLALAFLFLARYFFMTARASCESVKRRLRRKRRCSSWISIKNVTSLVSCCSLRDALRYFLPGGNMARSSAVPASVSFSRFSGTFSMFSGTFSTFSGTFSKLSGTWGSTVGVLTSFSVTTFTTFFFGDFLVGVGLHLVGDVEESFCCKILGSPLPCKTNSSWCSW